MKLVRGAWKILVGIKDFLVLVLMLLFFTGLFAVLSARPNAAAIRDGALVIAFDGALVEQPADGSTLSSLGGGGAPRETRLRDVLQALEAARTDGRVKAVVLDLDRFGGGYPAAVGEVADAVLRVRQAGKPVLAYATGYMDRSYQIAAAATEIWAHPMGGALFMGPGGSQLYYKGLIDKLGVNAHVFKVGRFKSAVEPYTRTDMSPEAREANGALYTAILDQWRQDIARLRPKAKVGDYLTRPDALILPAHGDLTAVNLATGVIDKVGDRLAFGKRVAEAVGVAGNKPAGNFNAIRLADFVAAHPLPTHGDAIGVITVAGEIVDGKAGAGTAGGDTVAGLVLKGLAEKSLKALVVRIDSPGGSVTGAEQIRQAILQAKAQKLPVVVSMGGMAASGGYWIATPADTIFAEPTTVTGSIGIFAILPSFENSLAKIGVTADGVRSTPLSGQPDVMGGLTPQAEQLLQSAVEAGYDRFIRLVSQTRRLSPERVDEIGQGRVWIGGVARQLKLVDRFGGLNDAIAEAARRAGIDPKAARPVFLEKEQNGWLKFLADMTRDAPNDDWVAGSGGGDAEGSGDLFAQIAAERRALLGQALGDARRLASAGSVQARCLACAGLAPRALPAADRRLLDILLARIGL